MKKFTLFAAVALLATLVPITAPAKDLILNISGTIKVQGQDNGIKGTIISQSINEKNIYGLLTNVLANNYDTLGTNISPVALPSNGYIAYSTNVDAGGNLGFFYVTNKTGFYYPLSGLDATNGYYSFIELDTFIYFGNDNGLNFGYGDVFSDLESYSLNQNTGNGSATGVSTAVLYIHDNPYAYNDADFTDTLVGGYDFFNGPQNENALEIRGILTIPMKYVGGLPFISSFSLTGSGNCLLGGSAFASLVSNGKATLSP